MLAALLLFAPLRFRRRARLGGDLDRADLALLLVAIAALEWPVAAWGRALRVAAAACFGLGGRAFLQAVDWPERLAALVSPRHVELWRQARPLVAARLGGSRCRSLRTRLRCGRARPSGGGCGYPGGRPLVPRARRGAGWRARSWVARCSRCSTARRAGWRTPSSSGGSRRRVRRRGCAALRQPQSLRAVDGVGAGGRLAALWWGVRRARREPALERRIALIALPGLLWLTIFAALVFSGSRGGLSPR